MQSTMRKDQTKTLKRGRKKGRGNAKTRSSRKRAVLQKKLKKTKANRKKKEAAVQKTASEARKTSKQKKETASKSSPGNTRKRPCSKPAEGEVYQERIYNANGKTWVYMVHKGQEHGCAACRKSTFRGKSATKKRQEQQAALASTGPAEEAWNEDEAWNEAWDEDWDEDWAGWHWDHHSEQWVQDVKEAEVTGKQKVTRKVGTKPSKSKSSRKAALETGKPKATPAKKRRPSK